LAKVIPVDVVSEFGTRFSHLDGPPAHGVDGQTVIVAALEPWLAIIAGTKD
jgi:hypothetical protein